jgi:hypothetical protein
MDGRWCELGEVGNPVKSKKVLGLDSRYSDEVPVVG